MAFDNNKLGELRPNQIITTFGPGSIVDAVKDSVTVLDTNFWKEKGKKIIDGRLASYLGVDCFYMPRTSYMGDVPVVTFPYAHVCSNLQCGRLFDARENFDLDKYLKFGVTCPDCHRSAYPARFITICENGHMDDFPWQWWVHRGDTSCNGKLRMYSTGNTSTLADMWVECKTCGAKRSMSGATQKENFEGLSCTGHHAFRPSTRNKKCTKPIIPSQRGASNVYFAVNRSAISIPPWINPLYNLIDEHLKLIEEMKDLIGDEAVTKVYEKYFTAYSRQEFDEALQRRLDNITEFKEIKQMEYEAKGWKVTTLRNAAYVLMHTFSHLMIKQMSMSSGYSSSAIRERIYFSDKMSGILLYTGSADKEGSLGGLVELGNINKLVKLMGDAFQEALLCTNDPECMNNMPAGNNSNGAACHSCCMISETACENGNRMLDRGLVVPIGGRGQEAYFKELVADLCQLEI